MLRRVHTSSLQPGRLELDTGEARHVRDVLRLSEGDVVEAFDDAGNVAAGKIVECGSRRVVVEVTHVTASVQPVPQITIASAIPRGERADWMIEKLSELGCACFIPLAAARSVVLPEGKNKRERWLRIAAESAKQSRRAGVMQIENLTALEVLLGRDAQATDQYHLSTAADAPPILDALRMKQSSRILLLIGPEGGWTDAELNLFAGRTIMPLKLTDTVLRIETAAIAAAVAAALAASNRRSQP